MLSTQVGIGAAVVSHRGEILGYVGAVYVDNATGWPTWAAVQGRRHSAVVPLECSRFDGASLHVPFDAEQLQSAPHHDPSTLISYAEGDDLARHYGLLPTPPAQSDPGHPTAPGDVAPTEGAGAEEPGARASGPGGSGEVEDGMMIRSVEQLRAATVNVVVGRARLVKYIVTEQMTYTVPVSREEVRIEYDPLPTHEQTINDTAPAEETYEVVRHTEQVMFTKQVVPVERVRLVRHVRTTEATLTEQVRTEQIDMQQLDPGGRGHHDAQHDGAGAAQMAAPGDTPRAGEQPWD